MEDYARYLNALQSANFADNTVEIQDQGQTEKQEAVQPLGEMLTAGGLQHLATGAYGALKNMAIEKAKDVAREALQKAGVGEKDAEELLKGNFDKVAKAKVQDAIDKAKAKVDEVKSNVEDKVDEVKANVENKVDELKSNVEDTVNEAKQSLSGENTGELDVVNDETLTNNLANESANNLANDGEGTISRAVAQNSEFEDNSDLLEAPRMLQQSGGIRPQPTEAPAMEDGTELTDMTGYANQAQSLAETATSQLSDLTDAALSTATTTASSIAPAVSDAVGAASTALSGAASTLTEAASGITSAASSAVSGLGSAVSAATGAAVGGEAAAEAIGTTIGSTVLEAASSFLGPLGILAAIGGGVASLVEGFQSHNSAPVLNPSSQFL